jgi:hypothetical protein
VHDTTKGEGGGGIRPFSLNLQLLDGSELGMSYVRTSVLSTLNLMSGWRVDSTGSAQVLVNTVMHEHLSDYQVRQRDSEQCSYNIKTN